MGNYFFFEREMNPKENAHIKIKYSIFFMNMEIALNFKAVKLG